MVMGRREVHNDGVPYDCVSQNTQLWSPHPAPGEGRKGSGQLMAQCEPGGHGWGEQEGAQHTQLAMVTQTYTQPVQQ